MLELAQGTNVYKNMKTYFKRVQHLTNVLRTIFTMQAANRPVSFVKEPQKSSLLTTLMMSLVHDKSTLSTDLVKQEYTVPHSKIQTIIVKC